MNKRMKRLISHLLLALVFCCSANLYAQDFEKCEIDDPLLQGEYKGGCLYGEAHGKGQASSDKANYKGLFRYGLKHGEGTYVVMGQFKYKGEFKNDLFHGFGKMEWDDGRKYEGQWEDGLRSGQGTMTEGKGIVFNGVWKNDQRNGYGVQKQGKDLYEGDWENNQHNGNGVQYYESGEFYKGAWENNQYHGQGAIVYATGGTYNGQWKDGKRHGEGVFLKTEKLSGEYVTTQYEGLWQHDVYHGNGTLTIINSNKKPSKTDEEESEKAKEVMTKYVGEWVNGMKEGIGKQIFSGDKENDAYSYEGIWQGGQMSGYGEKITSFDIGKGKKRERRHNRYVGEFKDGLANGQGITYFNDGEVQAKDWANGKPQKNRDPKNLMAVLQKRYQDRFAFSETAQQLVSRPTNFEGVIANNRSSEVRGISIAIEEQEKELGEQAVQDRIDAEKTVAVQEESLDSASIAKTTPIPIKKAPVVAQDAKKAVKEKVDEEVFKSESFRDKVIQQAKTYLGTPYNYGGLAKTGIDCSGLILRAFESIKITLPHRAIQIYGNTDYFDEVTVPLLKPGDLLFFDTATDGNRSSRVSHVAMYIGDDQMIHASSSKGVTIDSMNSSYWKNKLVGCRSFHGL